MEDEGARKGALAHWWSVSIIEVKNLIKSKDEPVFVLYFDSCNVQKKPLDFSFINNVEYNPFQLTESPFETTSIPEYTPFAHERLTILRIKTNSQVVSEADKARVFAV